MNDGKSPGLSGSFFDVFEEKQVVKKADWEKYSPNIYDLWEDTMYIKGKYHQRAGGGSSYIAPSIMPSSPITPLPVMTKLHRLKEVQEDEFQLLPVEITTGLVRNRVTFENLPSDWRDYCNEHCVGLFTEFAHVDAVGFELEEDLVMFTLKYHGASQ